MDEHKDEKTSSGSEKSVVSMDNFITSSSDLYSSSDTSNDVEKGAKEEKNVKEGRKRKNIERKPSSVTPLQGEISAVKEKITKARIGEK
eukprot:10866647-Ditylum_brightwellii.AAC.1